MENETLPQRLQALGNRWRRLPPAGRGLTLGLVLAALLSVAVASYLNRPTHVALGQFEARDAGAVTAKLTQLKVPYQPGPDGQTIMVPQADLFTARLAVAQAGISGDGTTGYELFDKPQFGATELEQQVNLRRALEGELARALQRLAAVERVQVRLAIPERSAFVREQQAPSAAVLLQLRPGAQLAAPEVAGLVRFVAASVPELKPAAVTLIDEHGRLLNDVTSDDPDGALAPALARQRLDLERTLEARVLGLLEPVFGRGNVVAKVALDVDAGKRTVESHTLLPGADGQPLIRSQEQTRETTSPGTPAVAPSAMTGVPQYLTSSPATGSTDRTQTTTNYDYSEQRVVDVTPAGAVRRVTSGVVINAGGSLSAAEVDQIRQTVAASLGAALADVTVSVMPFRGQKDLQTLFAEPVPAPATRLPAWLLGAMAAVLLAGLLLWALRRRSPSEPLPAGWPATEAPAPPRPEGRPRPEPVAPATAAAATAPAENLDDLDISDPAQTEAILASLLGADSVVLANPKVREQVEQAVGRRPQEAAAILSAWISERRR